VIHKAGTFNMVDHVHRLVGIPPKKSLADIIADLEEYVQSSRDLIEECDIHALELGYNLRKAESYLHKAQDAIRKMEAV
jgi:REP element-mobilizing transposase RayT